MKMYKTIYQGWTVSGLTYCDACAERNAKKDRRLRPSMEVILVPVEEKECENFGFATCSQTKGKPTRGPGS